MQKLKLASFLLISLFSIISIMIHFIRLDLDWSLHPLSRYAIGNYGWLMAFGLLCFGLSQSLLAIIIYFKKVNVASILSFVASLGVIIASFFPMDIGERKSTSGLLHIIGASLQFSLFPIYTLCLVNVIKQQIDRHFTVFVGTISVLFLFLLCLFDFFIKNDQAFSVIEKAYIIIMTVWIMRFELKMISANFNPHF